MDITSLMNKSCISFDQLLSSKGEVFEYLSEQLLLSEYITSKELFLEALYYRESLSETGLGDGIAIPHGKAECVKRAGIAFVRLQEEIEWESLDDKPIKYVFMLAIPQLGGDNEHIKMISELARSLIRRDIIEKIAQTDSSNELLECFRKGE